MTQLSETRALLILSVVLSTGCSGGDGAGPAAPPTATTAAVATVQVSYNDQPLAKDSSVQMSAAVKTANGVTLYDRSVTWSSSDPSLATVSAGGLVKALAGTGTVTITATSEGKSGSAAVTLWWLYQPPATYPVRTSTVISVRDSARARDIPVIVRYPNGAPGPLPVVFLLWPFEMGDSLNVTWGNQLAAAGYAVVHAGGAPPDLAQYCAEFHVPTTECTTSTLIWPQRIATAQNASVLLNQLSSIGTKIGQTLDATHVAVAGASAGAAVAMYLAGATVTISPSVTGVSLADKRFAAFLANSAPGQSTQNGSASGFTATSWSTITKPAMQQTSATEETERKQVYDVMPAGDKYLGYFGSNVYHGDFTLETNSSYKALIFIDGLAFLDAYLRGSATAKEWLTTNQLGRGTKRSAEMFSK